MYAWASRSVVSLVAPVLIKNELETDFQNHDNRSRAQRLNERGCPHRQDGNGTEMNRSLVSSRVWPEHWTYPSPLSLTAGLIALVLVLPLTYVVGNAFLVPGEVWAQLWVGRVPGLLWNTLRLAAGVGIVTLVWGIGLAWVVVRYDFPGRRVWSWLLAAPLGIPPYIMAYVYTELFAYWGPCSPGAALGTRGPAAFSLQLVS